MNFISMTFFLSFIFCFIIYYMLPKKLRWIWLLVISVIFYVSFLPMTTIYVLISILTTYITAILLEHMNMKYEDKATCRNRKNGLLAVCIIINVAILFVLKYFNFGISLFKYIVPSLGILDHISGVNFMIPIGISFYTLQVIGYCIDVYKGSYKAEKNIAKYSLFVIYFPHILQGPIARYNSISQTLYQGNSFNYRRVKYGFQLLLYGYFKKLVIADRAAIFVNHVYNNYQSFEGFHIAIASVLYSIQLYMDFSGCVDITLGISEMFGIKLGKNFDHPYFAVSIKDFWRRWHISLSSWFKDYIYIPLGGGV